LQIRLILPYSHPEHLNRTLALKRIPNELYAGDGYESEVEDPNFDAITDGSGQGKDDEVYKEEV
jgi:hypothetical protein